MTRASAARAMIRDVARFGDARAGAVAGAEKNGATVRQIRKDCVP
jgi:hypothetical protein